MVFVCINGGYASEMRIRFVEIFLVIPKYRKLLWSLGGCMGFMQIEIL